jgi:thymidylate synthase (FAD)
MSEINVLDHGYVRLVDSMGNDLSVVRAARVSYDAQWRHGVTSGDSDARLIKYLWANRHTSPFEHVSFTFEVKAPIFVFRQWHRHRTWKFNEVSARYTELPEEFYVPDISKIGVQSKKSKQVREFRNFTDDSQIMDRVAQISNYETTCQESFKIYRDLLAKGWPREIARAVLPLATFSSMFATVDLHNLFKFLGLRLHEHAQYEIREYAGAMADLIKPIVPVCYEAWENSHE